MIAITFAHVLATFERAAKVLKTAWRGVWLWLIPDLLTLLFWHPSPAFVGAHPELTAFMTFLLALLQIAITIPIMLYLRSVYWQKPLSLTETWQMAQKEQRFILMVMLMAFYMALAIVWGVFAALVSTVLKGSVFLVSLSFILSLIPLLWFMLGSLLAPNFIVLETAQLQGNQVFAKALSALRMSFKITYVRENIAYICMLAACAMAVFFGSYLVVYLLKTLLSGFLSLIHLTELPSALLIVPHLFLRLLFVIAFYEVLKKTPEMK